MFSTGMKPEFAVAANESMVLKSPEQLITHKQNKTFFFNNMLWF